MTAGAPLAVVRTPPAYALYLGGAESALLPRVLGRLADGGAQTVVLPRTPEQADAVDALGIEGVHVPRRAVDGRSLVALADLLVSAGGTMNREAAVLGTPVWSMFEGRLGAVDELLVHQGRLRLLRDPDDIVVDAQGRHRGPHPARSGRAARPRAPLDPMSSFDAFDRRGYRTVDARTGYGAWAPTYEGTVQDAMDVELLDALTELDVAGATVADLGCGSGRTGAWLHAHGAEAIDGADVTPEMLEMARARGVFRTLVEADVGRHRPAGAGLRRRDDLARRRAPRRPAPALRRGGAPAAPGRDVRDRRLPPALHHGLGHADPLRRRRRRAGRDRDARPPALRPGRRGARGGLPPRRAARAARGRRLGRAQAEVGRRCAATRWRSRPSGALQGGGFRVLPR